jgi:hypothetical protein
MSEEEETGLGPDSTITELFEAVMPKEGMRVVPTQLPHADAGKAQLAILITGNAEEANVMMAQLMSYVTDMHMMAAQHEANEASKRAALVDASGQAISSDDEQKIIIP